nr:PIG-L family deacetylase [uncultured Pseudomonas sp.]
MTRTQQPASLPPPHWQPPTRRNLPLGRTTSLQAWKASRQLAGVPPISCRQLVPTGKRAVIVATHPADEVLGCGGLLQLLCQEQRPMLLISVTNGSSDRNAAARISQRRMGIIRSQESAEALSRLGLSLTTLKWVHGGFSDAEVALHEEELQRFLSMYLQPSDVVVSTWRCDGHSDHHAVAQACLQACEELGATFYEMPIWTWHWASPEDPRIPWERARKLPLDRNAQARKRHAIQAFASQLYGDPPSAYTPKLTPTMLQRWQQPFELFFL